MTRQVDGIYPWPYDGPWATSSAALIVVDMQEDFLHPDGWFAITGGDPSLLRSAISPVARAIALARAHGMFVCYTIEAHRPDLADVPANKLWRSQRLGHAIGEVGRLGRHLIQGEAGTSICSELTPNGDEPIVLKPGKSAFIGSNFDQILRNRDIRNLIFVGITTDGAVQCTLRDANDRGYECLILTDATASDVLADHVDQIQTLALAGGHYGSIADLARLGAALDAAESMP